MAKQTAADATITPTISLPGSLAVVPRGIAHGATNALGFHAVENRHYVTDIHATVLHQLGRLEVPGRRRLELDFGRPICENIA